MPVLSLLALAAAVARAPAAAVPQDADGLMQGLALEAEFAKGAGAGAAPPYAAEAAAESKGGVGLAAPVTETASLENPAAQEAKPAPGGSDIFSTLWGASVEAACFFLSLAAVRLASSKWAHASPSKTSLQRSGTCGTPKRIAAGSIEALAATGQPLAVLKAWRRQQAGGPLSLEALKAVAQALADAEPERLAEELAAHLERHGGALARPSTIHALLDTITQAGRPDLAEAFLNAAEQRLNVAADVRAQEILLGAFSSMGDEKKVEELLAKLGCEATARAYALVIKGFMKSGKAAAATGWLLEMQRQGFEVPPRAVVELCKAAALAGAVPETFSALIAQGVQLPPECLAPLLGDCAQREDFKTARWVEQFARERSMPLTHACFESLLKLHAKVDDETGVRLFKEMQQHSFTASEGLCGCILAKCAESQNLRLAENVASYLRSRSAMTLSTYKTLMKVYACGGQYDKACDLYEDLRKHNIEPDQVMYGCLVKFAVKCGRSALSQSLFEKAGGGYVQNYMWLIRSSGHEGNVKRALELLRQLEAQQPQGLDIMVYNCALDACVMNGELEQAQALLKEMRKSFSLNLITYNTLMKGHCSRGDFQKARRVFADMEEAGIAPDSASFNCLISTAVTAGNMAQVWGLLAEMDQRGVRVDQYTVSIMMKASRKCSAPLDADRALAVLDRPGVNVCQDEVLFNTVLDACIHRRQKIRLAKAVETYWEAKSMKPSVRTYGLLIKACSILKMSPRIWTLWLEMVDHRKMTPNDITLSCMLDALIEARHIEDALELFREWKAKVPYNTVIYSTLIKGFASAGDSERAMAAYRDMKTEKVQMNLVAYTALIDSQARSGNVEQATMLLRCMEEDGCQPNTITFSNVVKGHCFNGDLATAMRVFQEMLDRGLAADTVIFNTLLDGCVRHSHFELADQLLLDMDKYRVTASNFTVSIVVKMWGKRRDLDRAFEAVRSSLRGPARLTVDPLVGACLVGACIHNRSIDRALEAFQEIKGWGQPDCPDANTYGALICGMARHGRCLEAVKLTDEITSQSHASAKDAKDGLGREPLRQLFKALHVHGRARDLGQPLAERLRSRGVQVEHRWFHSA